MSTAIKSKKLRNKWKGLGLCVRCGKKRDEEIRLCRKCQDKQNAWTRKKNRQVKEQVIEHYGGKCSCCNESILEFLTIDHIQGGGRQHRKEIRKVGGNEFYRWITKNEYPFNLQILCWNCNCAKGFFGKCPHQD